MSCNCGVLKKNVCDAGVFSLAKLGMTGTAEKPGQTTIAKKLKRRVLTETAVFGLSGIVFDWTLYAWLVNNPMLKDYNVGSALQSDIATWSKDSIRSVYQVLILGFYDWAMGDPQTLKMMLETVVAVGIANFGPDMLKGMEKSM